MLKVDSSFQNELWNENKRLVFLLIDKDENFINKQSPWLITSSTE
jgi:hypothetical protein